MRQASFSRPWDHAASDDRRGRDAVVRGTKRRIGHDWATCREHSGDGVDSRYLERLLARQRRQDAWKPPRSIVFPVPGGPTSSKLWPPAAASSSARRPRSWPRTSAKSGPSEIESSISGG